MLCACGSHQRQPADTAGQPVRTVIKTFSAYRANGDLALPVADVATGNCWTASVAAPSAGAYRCIAGNAILDPCFAPAHPSTPLEVTCVADPWSDAQVVRVTGALPEPPSTGRGATRPWAIQLANGVRCVAATGTVPAINGVNLDFHCRNGWDAAVRDDSAATVTADYGDPDMQVLRTVAVTTIWRV